MICCQSENQRHVFGKNLGFQPNTNREPENRNEWQGEGKGRRVSSQRSWRLCILSPAAPHLLLLVTLLTQAVHTTATKIQHPWRHTAMAACTARGLQCILKWHYLNRLVNGQCWYVSKCESTGSNGICHTPRCMCPILCRVMRSKVQSWGITELDL